MRSNKLTITSTDQASEHVLVIKEHKSLLWILMVLLLPLCANAQQSPEQLVRDYVSKLDDFLHSPLSPAKQNVLTDFLNTNGTVIRDEIFNNLSDDRINCTGNRYTTIISDAIRANRNHNYAEVKIAKPLEVRNEGSEGVVVSAYLRYSLAIDLMTVTDFRIKNGKMILMTNNDYKTLNWRQENLQSTNNSNTNNQRPHPNNTARDNSRDSLNIELMRKAQTCLFEIDQLKDVPYCDLRVVNRKLDSARIYLSQAADNGNVLSEIVLGFLMFDDRLRDIMSEKNIYQKEFCETPTRGKHTIAVKQDIGYQKFHVKYFRNIISKYASGSLLTDKYSVGYAYYALAVLKKRYEFLCGIDALIPESVQTLLDKSVEYNCDVVQIARAFDIKEKNAEQAKVLLNKVLEQNRSSYFVEDALYLLGVISFANKDYQEAYNYFVKAATDEWPDHYIHSGADYLIKYYGDLFDEPKKNHKTLVSLINRGYHNNNHDINSYDFIYHKVIWGLH